LAVQGLTRLEIMSGTSARKLHGGISSCTCRVHGVSVQIDYVFTYGRVEEVEEEE
jgi:hypothetical protein